MFKNKKLHQNVPRHADATFDRGKTLKRNREYFDIGMIEGFEQQQKLRRRTPFSHDDGSPHKIDDTFYNSTTAFSFKLENDIEKFKQRVTTTSVGSSIRQDESSIQVGDHLRDKINSIDIGRVVSREQIEKLKQRHLSQNQERYNNFSLMVPDETHVRDFKKDIPRARTVHSQLITPSINIDKVKTKYEQLFFTKTRESFDYKKAKEQRGPIYYPKKYNLNQHPIPEDKICKGMNKTRAEWNKKFCNFKVQLSAASKCQFEMLYYGPNRMFKPSQLLRNSDQIKEIKVKNRHKFVELGRNQICDIQYFRREKLRMLRPENLLIQ